jgi:hypothetical protein
MLTVITPVRSSYNLLLLFYYYYYFESLDVIPLCVDPSATTSVQLIKKVPTKKIETEIRR